MRRTASGRAMGGLLVRCQGMSMDVHAPAASQKETQLPTAYRRLLRRPLEPTIRHQTAALVPKRPEIRAAVAPRSAIRLDAALHAARHRTWKSPDFLGSPQSAGSVLLPRLVVSPTR